MVIRSYRLTLGDNIGHGRPNPAMEQASFLSYRDEDQCGQLLPRNAMRTRGASSQPVSVRL